jgi:hypothetical protein
MTYTHADPLDTIAHAIIAAEIAVGAERSPRALIEVQIELVRDLARSFGVEMDRDSAAARALTFMRLAAPMLDADVRPDPEDPRTLDPSDAATLTACVGMNMLAVLRAASIGRA